MGRLVFLALFCLGVVAAALWAVKTGGTVAFQGQGWQLEISLWAFVTSLLSGAGLLWILVIGVLWILKSPFKVFAWLRRKTHRDRTIDLLLDMEYLQKSMIAPIKKHLPYGHDVLQAYLQAHISLEENQPESLDKALKTLDQHAALLACCLRMKWELKRQDPAMALRYGLDIYRQEGPVLFNELLDLAEASQRIDLLQPYLEKAYQAQPQWRLLKHLIPSWQDQGKERRLLSELKKCWLNEQQPDIFDHICRFEALEDPLQKVRLFKKLMGQAVLKAPAYETLHHLCLSAGLWGEAVEAKKHYES